MRGPNNIRPFQGQVLVEMLPSPLENGLWVTPTKDYLRPQEGIVRRIGTWRQARKSRSLIPYDFRVGDKVLVDRRSWGPIIDRHIGERFRLVKADQILAVLT